MENFKKILRQNLIKNCPVTVEHVNLAEKIFGADVATKKGKSTRPKSPRVVNDLIEIPKEIKENNNKLVLCIDNMFVNNIPMFTSIDKTVRFRALVPLNGRNSEELFRALDVVLRKYNGAGYEIEQINCDREFKKIMDEIK